MAGGPLALLLTAVFPSMALLWLAILAVALMTTLGSDPARLSGAEGEDYTLNFLKKLPDNYVVFNQLELPDERSSTGLRELDFIVCGPNGIFVIESKNHNGEITGSEHDKEWTIHKVGRGGTPYSDSIRNPVKQVKQQVRILRNYLASHNIQDGVYGAVALSSNNSLSNIQSGSTAVIHSSALAGFITSQSIRHAGKNLARTVDALAQLRRESA